MAKFVKGNRYGFQPGQSGNPRGRKPLIENIHELAREHAAEAIAGLVEFMRQREDKQLAMSAMIALLDRGFGKPPVAVYAQIGDDQVIRYDIRWADAATNSFPEEKAAPVIDAAASNGEAEGEAEAEPMAIAQYCWGDGSPVK